MKTLAATVKSALVAFLVLAASSAALMAQTPATAPVGTPTERVVGVPEQPMTEAERVVRTALRKRLAEAKFVGQDLKTVLEWLQAALNTNIVVRWTVLETVAVSPQTKVKDVSLKDVAAETVLNEVLRQMQLAPGVRIEYAIKDNVIFISTADDLREMTTEVYDVSDIVEGASPSDVRNLQSTVVSLANAGVVEFIRGSLAVRGDGFEHERVRQVLDQLKRNVASRPPSARDVARQSAEQITAVLSMKETCFDPQAMCVAALGCLRTETKETPEQLAKTLEALLAETKALGVRNAIRLMLKDLYIQAGNTAKAKEHLMGIIKDNEKAAQAAGPTSPRAPASPPGGGYIPGPPCEGGGYPGAGGYGGGGMPVPGPAGGTYPPPGGGGGYGGGAAPSPGAGATAPPPDAGATSANRR